MMDKRTQIGAILAEAERISAADEGDYEKRSKALLTLIGSHAYSKLEWHGSMTEFFARSYGFNLRNIAAVPGLDDLIESMIDDAFDWTRSHHLNTRAAPLALTVLRGAHLVLPRPLENGLPIKPESMFYPLKDLMLGDVISADYPFEPLSEFRIGGFRVLRPEGGGTHRMLGIALAFGMMDFASLRCGAYDIYEADYNPLPDIERVVRRVLACADGIEVQMHSRQIRCRRDNGSWESWSLEAFVGDAAENDAPVQGRNSSRVLGG